jgi:F0F1-type ATP synthase membrane subunit c/vacuolar-type H+-ATPase subunit K
LDVITPQLLAVVGACIMEILAMLGSSSGCLKTGIAGAATLSEDLGQFKNTLILAAAPLTQTFYALIVLVTNFSIIVPRLANAPVSLGWYVFAICMITGFAECHSAYWQGCVCVAGISLLPKSKGSVFTGVLLMAAYLELEGVTGMVFAIMSFTLLKLM